MGNLKNVLNIRDKYVKYDTLGKTVLTYKCILAYIIQQCVTEFKDIPLNEIEKEYLSMGIIEDNVAVNRNELVIPEVEEDSTLDEGTVIFDFVISVRRPNSKEGVSIVINIENQRSQNPGYALVTRGIYYCARLLSRQYERTFSNSDYSKINKVYSIWLCTNPPMKFRNKGAVYSIKEDLLGDMSLAKKENYDLINTSIICIDRNNLDTLSREPSIFKFLSIIFSENISGTEKCQYLEKEFSIPVDNVLERSLDDMGGLGQSLYLEHQQELADFSAEKDAEKDAEIKKERTLTILNLIDMNLSIPQIAKAVSLPIEEVQEIVSNNKNSTFNTNPY